ncbi:MAG: AI-2E family transporter, partial [Patescibacteria group bacterium]
MFNYIISNQFIAGLAIIAAGILVWEVREILVAVFISYVIMSALYPAARFLMDRKFPKILAIAIPYLLSLGFIILLILPLLPFFVAQIQSLFENLPVYVRQSSEALGISIQASQISSYITSSLESITRNAFSVTGKIFGGIFSILTIIIVSFYLLVYHDRLDRFFVAFFPRSLEPAVAKVIADIEIKLGAWLRGQIFLSFAVGFLTWVALTILGLDFALPLALLAGILEIVPTIGPIISAIPAVIVAFAISPSLAGVTALAYVGIQLAENNFLVPKIMQKAVGLNPVIVIVGIIMGAKLMGVLGALLAVP